MKSWSTQHRFCSIFCTLGILMSQPFFWDIVFARCNWCKWMVQEWTNILLYQWPGIGGRRMNCLGKIMFIDTRWGPTSSMELFHGFSLYKWPYKWLIEVITRYEWSFNPTYNWWWGPPFMYSQLFFWTASDLRLYNVCLRVWGKVKDVLLRDWCCMSICINSDRLKCVV